MPYLYFTLVFLSAGTETVITSLWRGGPMQVRYTLLTDSRHRPDDHLYFTEPDNQATAADYLYQNDAAAIPYDNHTTTLDVRELFLSEEQQNEQFLVTATGDVVLQRPLDHETQRSHVITVLNQTLNSPPTLDYMTIVVVVRLQLNAKHVVMCIYWFLVPYAMFRNTHCNMICCLVNERIDKCHLLF